MSEWASSVLGSNSLNEFWLRFNKRDFEDEIAELEKQVNEAYKKFDGESREINGEYADKCSKIDTACVGLSEKIIALRDAGITDYGSTTFESKFKELTTNGEQKIRETGISNQTSCANARAIVQQLGGILKNIENLKRDVDQEYEKFTKDIEGIEKRYLQKCTEIDTACKGVSGTIASLKECGVSKCDQSTFKDVYSGILRDLETIKTEMSQAKTCAGKEKFLEEAGECLGRIEGLKSRMEEAREAYEVEYEKIKDEFDGKCEAIQDKYALIEQAIKGLEQNVILTDNNGNSFSGRFETLKRRLTDCTNNMKKEKTCNGARDLSKSVDDISKDIETLEGDLLKKKDPTAMT